MYFVQSPCFVVTNFFSSLLHRCRLLFFSLHHIVRWIVVVAVVSRSLARPLARCLLYYVQFTFNLFASLLLGVSSALTIFSLHVAVADACSNSGIVAGTSMQNS